MNLFDDIRETREKERADKERHDFIKGLAGKPFHRLNINELAFLEANYPKTFEAGLNNRKLVIEDLEAWENMRANNEQAAALKKDIEAVKLANASIEKSEKKDTLTLLLEDNYKEWAAGLDGLIAAID